MIPPLEDCTSDTDSASAIPGWYGKLPCLGDFATRRLPTDFIEAWDAWLQRSIATSRQQLGERWLDVFLTSPMWRFALAPGVCGAGAYGGLLLPSVDKVGRYFPLTLALPLTGPQGNVADLFSQQDWYSQLESVGLSALNVDFSPDQLERALGESPFPAQRAASPRAPQRDVLACLRDVPPAPHAFHLPSIDTFVAAAAASAREIVADATSGKSYWWSVAHDSGATEFHCSAGLPPDDYFCVLIGGERMPATEAVSLDPLQALEAAAAR